MGRPVNLYVVCLVPPKPKPGKRYDVSISVDNRETSEWNRALKEAPTVLAKQLGINSQMVEVIGAY